MILVQIIGWMLGIVMLVNFLGELFPSTPKYEPLEPQPFPCSGRELVYYLIVLIALVAAFWFGG